MLICEVCIPGLINDSPCSSWPTTIRQIKALILEFKHNFINLLNSRLFVHTPDEGPDILLSLPLSLLALVTPTPAYNLDQPKYAQRRKASVEEVTRWLQETGLGPHERTKYVRCNARTL
jgi:hypothetical protein